MPRSRAPAPRERAYSAADRERWVAEPKKSPVRTAFERDRARLVHSAALRRLGAKTQVRTLWPAHTLDADDDATRTRLTHSLEVAQVGRELGKLLGCDPDVVDTACLAHDLGHPPFGHNGERALDEAASDIGGFEGNAQTLRVLTRLESKVADPSSGRSVGLNLTRASLDASVKYPWPRPSGPGGKFGVYAEDLEVFAWLRQGAAPGRRCLEAQVMDFADDVAYSVHDVEDGIVSGFIPLRGMGEWRQIASLAARRYAPKVEVAELEAAGESLVTSGFWPADFDGTRAGFAALKDLTSQLIGRFCTDATQATRREHGEGRLTRYSADLVVPPQTVAEIAILKALAAYFLMEPPERRPIYDAQRELLAELNAALLDVAPSGLSREFAVDWTRAGDEAARRRVVIDHIASLTDASAHALHARLTGRAQPPVHS